MLTSTFIAHFHAVSCKSLLWLSFFSSCNRHYVMDEFILNRLFLCLKLLILTGYGPRSFDKFEEKFAMKLTFDDIKFSAKYGCETDRVYVTAH